MSRRRRDAVGGAGNFRIVVVVGEGGGEKIVNAVINSSLMDNHQTELAEELEERDCASEWTTEAGATKFWEEAGSRELLPFHLGGRSLDDRGRREPDGSEGYVSGFQMMVDRVMGFSESWSRKNSFKTR